jgi:hypothetical protein
MAKSSNGNAEATRGAAREIEGDACSEAAWMSEHRQTGNKR